VSASPTLVLVSAAASTKHGSSTGSILLIVLVVGVLIFIVTNGRRKQKAAQSQQAEIEIGTMVVTRAGLIATLVDRTDDYVVLQLDDGTRARYVPAAVAQPWHEPVPDTIEGATGAEIPVEDDPPGRE
jgi:preprotein translocase subunit YajC